jgi:hypothetical protein
MTTRRNRRITLTVQLKPDDDTDLIVWTRTVAPGGMNAALKALMRAALDLPQPPTTAAAADMTSIDARIDAQQRVIEQLRADLADVRRQLTQGHVNRAAVAPTPAAATQDDRPAVSDDVVALRAKRLNRQSW